MKCSGTYSLYITKPEQNYMLHISGKLFGKRSNQQSIKEGTVRGLYNRADPVKHYKKSEHKWKKELKVLNKKNKMLYSIYKKSSLCREPKKIKNIKAKASKKRSYSSRNSSSSVLDSDSSLSNDSDWYEERQTNERKRDK